tara:strand:- start:79 stop:207 length:129 start_codon:yes stop_codon:yes gene_type:complete
LDVPNPQSKKGDRSRTGEGEKDTLGTAEDGTGLMEPIPLTHR